MKANHVFQVLGLLTLAGVTAVPGAAADDLSDVYGDAAVIEEDGKKYKLIEVGAGAGAVGGEFQVVLRASYDGIRFTRGHDEYYLARIRARVGTTFDEMDAPDFEVVFTPVLGKDLEWVPGWLPASEVSFLPTTVSRNMRFNEEFGVSVSVVGFAGTYVIPQFEGLSMIMSMSVEALGAKYINYASDHPDFVGARLARIRSEVGEQLEFSEDFKVVLYVSNESDFSVGAVDGGFAIQSDIRTYLGVRVNLFQVWNLFFQAGTRYMGDTANDNFVTVKEFLAGFSFRF